MGLDLMMSHDEVILPDLLSALNAHRYLVAVNTVSV